MVENPVITVLDESQGTARCGSSTQVIGLELNIFGQPVNFRIGVAPGRAKLADIVPLARTTSDKLTAVVLNMPQRNGKPVSCRKGCSACCNYLVPLSVPEALRLKEEILTAPPELRESMQKACVLAAWRILNQGPLKPFPAQTQTASCRNPADLILLSAWYASLNLPCPFLCRSFCTIYEHRPLACREYFVSGPVKACETARADAEQLRMPVHMVEVLGQLASELEGTSVEAVIMPLAIFWGDNSPHRGRRTWPTAIMVERFIEILKAKACKTPMPAAASKECPISNTCDKKPRQPAVTPIRSAGRPDNAQHITLTGVPAPKL